VVLERRKGKVELATGPANLHDEELLGYLAAEAGTSGELRCTGAEYRTHGIAIETNLSGARLRLRLRWPRSTDARAGARRASDVQRAIRGSEEDPRKALDQIRCSLPESITPADNVLEGRPNHRQKCASNCIGAFARNVAYAPLCWWHGPAGYDVLGVNSEDYRLAPRLMDYEPETARRLARLHCDSSFPAGRQQHGHSTVIVAAHRAIDQDLTWEIKQEARINNASVPAYGAVSGS